MAKYLSAALAVSIAGMLIYTHSAPWKLITAYWIRVAAKNLMDCIPGGNNDDEDHDQR